MARPKKNTNTQALADKMRKAVLQAAIEGKLTEQNPSDDGHARDLLADIEAEKQRLIKAGEIKRQKSLPPITEEDQPFDIPDNWEWVRLGQLLTSSESGKSPKCEKTPVKDNEWGVLTTTSVQKNHFLQMENKILPTSFKPSTSMQVSKGDLLVTRAGPLNRTGVSCVVENIDYNLILSDKIVRLNYLYNLIDPQYLMFVINSSLGYSQVLELASGMDKQQVNLSQDKIKSFLVPLASLAEQQRIVTKLKEVLAQIDSLQTDEDELHRLQLAFPNQMQASLLQAAIEGKLTQQDAMKDGHASELLSKIDIEKQKLIKAGEIKRSKTLPPITEEEKPFDIPDNWEWVRLGEVTNYGQSKKANPENIPSQSLVIEMEDIEKETFKLLIKNYDRTPKSSKNTFERGDVLYGKLRPYLKKVIVVEDEGYCSTEIIPFNGFGQIDSNYLKLCMSSPSIDNYVNSLTHGMDMPRLGTEKARGLLIPLPPLAEQQRIVELLDQALPEIQTLKDI